MSSIVLQVVIEMAELECSLHSARRRPFVSSTAQTAGSRNENLAHRSQTLACLDGSSASHAGGHEFDLETKCTIVTVVLTKQFPNSTVTLISARTKATNANDAFPERNLQGPQRRHMVTSNYPTSLLNTGLGCQQFAASPKSSAADVVIRAQAGDPDAFNELYSDHKWRVFSVCMRIVRDSSLAEDLTQETFLQVFRKIAAFRGDANFTTWLHRVAVNTVLMHLRKRVLSVVSLDHLMSNVEDEHVGRSFGSRDLAQAGAIDRLAIDRAVADLAPGYRSIFLLHDVDGFDYSEIASMLKCSRGNTKFRNCTRPAALCVVRLRLTENGD